MNYWNESKDNIYVAAHRGWCSKYPENTMEAFKAAAEIGVDQIETDIRITKDGELVLIHDPAVDRTTDGCGKVAEMTLAELKQLDAGVKKGKEFKGSRIPTFIEFMEYVKDFPMLTLDLELKVMDVGSKHNGASNDEIFVICGKEYTRIELSHYVCDRVIEIVEKYNFGDRVVLNTFGGKLHDYIYEKYNGKYRQHVYFPISNLSAPTIDPYSYAYCCCMFGENNGEIMASKEMFEKMAARGVEPWAGAGVKDAAGVDMAIERGAVLITCNNPDEILNLLRERGKHA